MLPALAAVSLVMAATRHERTDLILQQSWRTAVWIVTFLGIVAMVIGVAMWFIG
jgi:hypothetical protein